ncbi:serine/threonine-protein kinase [Planoprotostelium fungivorum]|uniref:Serine/threonine-protein kinase n=1 Tax=Planoprotostelium fungivorum TaxID=1890364 RepID=A0A2P6NXZ3_9EUKA|nr:serine/threonine-protein kinase [Planoprotostelium fungivorum]
MLAMCLALRRQPEITVRWDSCTLVVLQGKSPPQSQPKLVQITRHQTLESNIITLRLRIRYDTMNGELDSSVQNGMSNMDISHSTGGWDGSMPNVSSPMLQRKTPSPTPNEMPHPSMVPRCESPETTLLQLAFPFAPAVLESNAATTASPDITPMMLRRNSVMERPIDSRIRDLRRKYSNSDTNLLNSLLTGMNYDQEGKLSGGKRERAASISEATFRRGQTDWGAFEPVHKRSRSPTEESIRPVFGTLDLDSRHLRRSVSVRIPRTRSDSAPNIIPVAKVDGREMAGCSVDEENEVTLTLDIVGNIRSCTGPLNILLGYQIETVLGQNMKMLLPTRHRNTSSDTISEFLTSSDTSESGFKLCIMALQHHDRQVFPVVMRVEQMYSWPLPLFRVHIHPCEESEKIFVTVDGTIVDIHDNIFPVVFGYDRPDIVGQNISVLFTSKEGSPMLGKSVSPYQSPILQKSPTMERQKWSRPGTYYDVIQMKDGSLCDVIVEITQEEKEGPRVLVGKIKRKMEFVQKKTDPTSTTKVGHWIIQETIGQGSHGKVRLGIHSTTRQRAAVKSVKKSKTNPEELEKIRREISIMRLISHPNITLRHHLKSYPGRKFPDDLCRRYFGQLLSAVSHCHTYHVIHRDIKHENILLSEDTQDIILIDFGMSNYEMETKFLSTFCGSPAFCAPEMFLAKQYRGPEVDVWSMGVCLYSIATGELPFDNVGAILSGEYNRNVEIPIELMDLLSKMMKVDPQERISIEGIRNHGCRTTINEMIANDFFKEFIWSCCKHPKRRFAAFGSGNKALPEDNGIISSYDVTRTILKMVIGERNQTRDNHSMDVILQTTVLLHTCKIWKDIDAFPRGPNLVRILLPLVKLSKDEASTVLSNAHLNEAFLNASERNHLETMELLLSHPRVDPTVKDNSAMRSSGSVEVPQ